jgi:alkanesulfonate monooxygenase SsuD/methylene tetrahydromethanopterin reductase-like flavin-dependent oxidoreductase (luciferase family)
MDLGVTIFLTDQSIGPVELAREVEQRGYSSLWLPEHTHIPTSRRTPAPMGEPLAEEYRAASTRS